MLRRTILAPILLLLLHACADSGDEADTIEQPSGMGGASANEEEPAVPGASPTGGDSAADDSAEGVDESDDTEDAPGDDSEPDQEAPTPSTDGAAEDTTGSESTDPDASGEPGSSDPDASGEPGSSDDTGSSDPAQPTADSGTDAAPGEISCDPRQLRCKRAAPQCDQGQVPRVLDGCYGECVNIDECSCSGPEACPNPDEFTCRNDIGRCTYYLR
jgi:hypothetical protein